MLPTRLVVVAVVIVVRRALSHGGGCAQRSVRMGGRVMRSAGGGAAAAAAALYWVQRALKPRRRGWWHGVCLWCFRLQRRRRRTSNGSKWLRIFFISKGSDRWRRYNLQSVSVRYQRWCSSCTSGVFVDFVGHMGPNSVFSRVVKCRDSSEGVWWVFSERLFRIFRIKEVVRSWSYTYALHLIRQYSAPQKVLQNGKSKTTYIFKN